MCVSSCRNDDIVGAGTGAGGIRACVFEFEAEFVVVRDEGGYLG